MLVVDPNDIQREFTAKYNDEFDVQFYTLTFQATENDAVRFEYCAVCTNR